MNRAEVIKIERNVEMEVMKAVTERQSALSEIVHEAVHKALTLALVPKLVKEEDDHPIPRAGGRLQHREIKNDIMRPAPGGRCDAVWSELDKLHGKKKATLEAIQAISDKKGWNSTNTRIEFYRWRKFNGLHLN